MSRKVILVAGVILIVLLFVWWMMGNKPQSSAVTISPTPEMESAEESDFLAVPEHLKNPENHALTLEITGPEGEKIFPAQARMYEAYIKGNAKYESAKINCHWKFYLNENNDEALYKEMTNSSGLSQAEKKVCAFTSTFMDKPGQLRVELTAELTTFAGESLEEVVAQRSYLVAK